MIIKLEFEDVEQTIKSIAEKGFCFAKDSIGDKGDIFITNSLASNLNKNKLGKGIFAKVCKSDKGYRANKMWFDWDHVPTSLEKNQLGEKLKNERKIQLCVDAVKKHRLKRDSVVFVDALSMEKEKILNERLTINKEKGFYPIFLIKKYTGAEYAVESYFREQGCDVYDYNTENLYAPQDCRINQVDYDVKTCISVGRKQGLVYTSRRDKTEKIIGVCTLADDYDDDSTGAYDVDGIFDIALYDNCNLELKYYPLNSKYTNVCYFVPVGADVKSGVDGSILIKESIPVETILLNNWLELYLNAIDICEQRIFLEQHLSPQNHGVIDIVEELLLKDKIYLLPHFIIEFIVNRIVCKQVLDVQNFEEIIFSLYMPTVRQKKYISHLLNANQSLIKVRCISHKNENHEKMEIGVYEGSYITLKAICSVDPRIKTTILSYSWKTREVLVYSGNNTCDVETCGCLIHEHEFRNQYIQKRTMVGKRSCPTFGEKYVDAIEEARDFVKNKIETSDSIDSKSHIINSGKSLKFGYKKHSIIVNQHEASRGGKFYYTLTINEQSSNRKYLSLGLAIFTAVYYKITNSIDVIPSIIGVESDGGEIVGEALSYHSIFPG